MKTCMLVLIICTITSLSGSTLAQNRFWVSSTTSNWNNAANWSATSGGVGGASVPGAAEVAIFDANGLGNCLLDIAPTIAGMTVNGYTATINFQGNNLTTTGTNLFSSGTLVPGTTAELILNTTGSTTFSGTTVNVNVSGTSADLFLHGSTFTGTVSLSKTGATNNDSNGGNAFLGALTTITNTGSGWLRMARSAFDTFGSGDLILLNSGTGTIRLADLAPGTIFNGNIFVNSTNGGGIYLGQNGGTSSIAAGKTISVGTSGFTTGELRLQQFAQADAVTPQTLLLTGAAALVIGPGIAISGSADFRAPQMFLNGGTFNGPAYIEKTGAIDDTGSGGVTFQSTATLATSGTGFFRNFGGNLFNGVTEFIGSVWSDYTTGSTYNGVLKLTSTNTSIVRAGNNFTAFNNDIEVNSTDVGGVAINDGSGTSTLAAGKTITVGSAGFLTGRLTIGRIVQIGITPQTITLGNTARLTLLNPTFNGNFTSTSGSLLMLNSTFYGAVNSITKTGTSVDNAGGGNIFSAGTNTTITNSDTGTLRLGTTSADTFEGDVTFTQSSGTITPISGASTNFSGNITVNSTAAINFGQGALGNVIFSGTANQTVNKTGTASPVFNRITVNKPSGSVTFNTDATVRFGATFTSGIVNTTAGNFLNFADNATTTGASNASFVDGPVRKTGNDAFTFPIGDNGFYRPAGISAPTSTAHFFTAQYFNTDHGLGSAGDPSFMSVTKCEYWQIDRNTGAASNVSVTLSWQEASCVPGYITDPATLRVARWNGASWVNHGNGGTTGTATNGTIVTSSAVTSFSPFTLASASIANPLPVELTWFKASVTSRGTGLLQWRTESELNNDRFEIQRSENGTEFTVIGTVNGAGTSNKAHEYQFEDQGVTLNLAYYRLKQIDFNGDFEYSQIVSLDFTGTEISTTRFMIAPNPVNRGSVATFKSGAANVRQTVTIFNGLNQAVKKYSAVDSFSTDDLTPGIYIVKNQAGEIFRLVVK